MPTTFAQKETMRALVATGLGKPLVLEERPIPQLKPGEVLVKMAASPINPSDLAALEEQYAVDWRFPFVPGLEGAGTVVDARAGRMGTLVMGRKVSVFAGRQGLWAEYAPVPVDQAIPVGRRIGFEQAAMSLVNPLTAIALVGIARQRGVTAVVNTAAAGALGRMIRKRAVASGMKVINIVRREEHVTALKAEGAVHVLNQNDESFVKDLRHLTNHYRATLAFDAIGGDMTVNLLSGLPKRGEVMIYGGLAMAPSPVTPDHFIFHNKHISGFWLVNWLNGLSLPQKLWHIRDVQRSFAGFAGSDVAQILDLSEALTAPAEYASDMSAGKILITPDKTLLA